MPTSIRPDLTKAREITEKANDEKRELTVEERAFVDPILKSAREIADGFKKVRDDAALMAAIEEATGCGGGMGASLELAKTQRLSASKAWILKSPREMMPDGMKALAPSGASVVGQEMKPDPVSLGQPALSLLDVIPTVTHAQTEFAYMRQTVRTDRAGVLGQNSTACGLSDRMMYLVHAGTRFEATPF